MLLASATSVVSTWAGAGSSGSVDTSTESGIVCATDGSAAGRSNVDGPASHAAQRAVNNASSVSGILERWLGTGRSVRLERGFGDGSTTAPT